MALFSISGHMDTGRCSQTQRPLTHQSKKLLCSAAPHHTKVLSFSTSFVLFLLLFHFPSLSSFTKHKPPLLLFHSLCPVLFRLAQFNPLPGTPPFSLIPRYLVSTSIPSHFIHRHSHSPFLSFHTELQKLGLHSSVVLQTKYNTACSQAAVEGASAISCLCTHWLQVCLFLRCLHQPKEHVSHDVTSSKRRVNLQLELVNQQ